MSRQSIRSVVLVSLFLPVFALALCWIPYFAFEFCGIDLFRDQGQRDHKAQSDGNLRFAIVGTVAAIAYGCFSTFKRIRLSRIGKRIKARVLRVGRWESGEMRRAECEFILHKVRYKASVVCLSGTYSTGDTIYLIVDPTNPRKVELAEWFYVNDSRLAKSYSAQRTWAWWKFVLIGFFFLGWSAYVAVDLQLSGAGSNFADLLGIEYYHRAGTIGVVAPFALLSLATIVVGFWLYRSP